MFKKVTLLYCGALLNLALGGVIPKVQTILSPKNLEISETVSHKWMSNKSKFMANKVTLNLVKKLPAEGYEIFIKNNEIQINYATEAGLFYSYVTLNQLKKLPKNLVIKDYPKYQWRGLMLDVSRHFFEIKDIKELIDEMASLKLNRLHLHLNDNEAWRVEIKAYDSLVKKGTHYENFPKLSDKFYTQEELKDLVAYASERAIMIVPEIDLPGHAQALLVALPEISCAGKGDFKLYPHEQTAGRYNQAPDAICVGKKYTYKVIENIIKELVTIFPAPYLHLGGDEVNSRYWQECNDCNALLKQQGIAKHQSLQNYFTNELSKLAKKYNKIMIGWDEINNREIANKETVVMCWRERGFVEAAKALKHGQKVILSPQYGCYFDWGYGGNSTRFVYEWEAISPPILPENAENILGIQACLWTEKVPDVKTLQERLFPRLAAIAENSWYGNGRNLKDFSTRLDNLKKQWSFRNVVITNDSLENIVFDPDKDQKVLVRNAKVSTNLPTFYAKEFAFDGRENSFFWSAAPADANSWFLIELGEAMFVQNIKVLTGDSKDFLKHGVLEISEDGINFEKVSDFKAGVAAVKYLNKKVSKIMIKATARHDGWLIIREVILE